jgi:hypothetical protein
LNSGANGGKDMLSVGVGGTGKIKTERDVLDVKEAAQKSAQGAEEASTFAESSALLLASGAIAESMRLPGTGVSHAQAMTALSKDSSSAEGKGGTVAGIAKTHGTTLKQIKMLLGDEAQVKSEDVVAAGHRLKSARSLLAKGKMMDPGSETIAAAYDSLMLDPRFGSGATPENRKRMAKELQGWISGQKGFDGAFAENVTDVVRNRSAADLATLMVGGRGTIDGRNLMAGEQASLAQKQNVHREQRQAGYARSRADDRMTLEGLGGTTGMADEHADELTRIAMGVSEATDQQWLEGGDPAVGGRRAFASYLGANKDSISDKSLGKMISQLSEGGAISQEMAVVAQNFKYYNNLWENNKRSPTKFLQRVTGESFKGLSDDLKRFQSSGRLSSDLEDVLISGAKKVWKAAHPGEKVDEKSVLALAGKMASSTTKGGIDELVTDLSTQHAPKGPGGDIAQSTSAFVSSLKLAKGAVDNFIRNM